MKTILERLFIDSDRYKLSDYKEGEVFPIVSDVMFHTMLNNESRKQYVSYFLSLVLEKSYEDIYNGIVFSKEQLDKENYHDSKKTVDLVCTIDGKVYNVEMNNNMDIPSLERNISYMEKLYSSSMKRGNKVYHYNNVVQININNFNFEGNENEIDKFYIMNSNKEVLTNKIQIIYIYLPLIRKKLYNKEKLTLLEKLLLVFNEKESEELNQMMKGDKIMSAYRNDAYEASQDSEVLGLYDKEKEQERLEYLRLEYATEKGIEQGIEQGIQRGSEQTRMEIAKNFLALDIPIEKISTATGIDIETLKNLK